MAIKNNIKANQYGAVPKPIDPSKIKPLAFDAIKKLLKKGYEVKTDFFVESQHFKDKDGNGAGHFLAIGESPSLLIKFKQKKTSPTVAYGELYVKKINNADVVHFVCLPGQGKLKKPGDWKPLFKVFKKMLKKECVLILGPEKPSVEAPQTEEKTATIPNSDQEDAPNTQQDKTKLVQKQKKQLNQILIDFKSIQNIYDLEKKKELFESSNNWFNEYALLEPDQKKLIKKEAQILQKVHSNLKTKIQLDQKVTLTSTKISTLLGEYTALEDLESNKAKDIEQTIKTTIDKIIPLTKTINDTRLLSEFQQIKELF